jgi:hypothetical protein
MKGENEDLRLVSRKPVTLHYPDTKYGAFVCVCGFVVLYEWAKRVDGRVECA